MGRPSAIDSDTSEQAVIARLEREIFLLQTLMDNVPDSIYFKDRDSRFTRINRYAAERFGIADPAQAVGRTDFDYFTDEHAASRRSSAPAARW
jgi:two-component system sensor histidine kinase/response regulator